MSTDDTAFAIAQLRHAYKQLYDGTVYRQREFAEGLLGPAIARLERALSPSPQPAPLPDRVMGPNGYLIDKPSPQPATAGSFTHAEMADFRHRLMVAMQDTTAHRDVRRAAAKFLDLCDEIEKLGMVRP